LITKLGLSFFCWKVLGVDRDNGVYMHMSKMRNVKPNIIGAQFDTLNNVPEKNPNILNLVCRINATNKVVITTQLKCVSNAIATLGSHKISWMDRWRLSIQSGAPPDTSFFGLALYLSWTFLLVQMGVNHETLKTILKLLEWTHINHIEGPKPERLENANKPLFIGYIQTHLQPNIKQDFTMIGRFIYNLSQWLRFIITGLYNYGGVWFLEGLFFLCLVIYGLKKYYIVILIFIL
ncbi:hypothetical protein ACJX0J_030110, partial [Zea mays]